MKNFRAADKSHAGGDEKHDINFHWPYIQKYRDKTAKNCRLLLNPIQENLFSLPKQARLEIIVGKTPRPADQLDQ
jgi:hypothetical protein